jgi:hypothetical protein
MLQQGHTPYSKPMFLTLLTSTILALGLYCKENVNLIMKLPLGQYQRDSCQLTNTSMNNRKIKILVKLIVSRRCGTQFSKYGRGAQNIC